MKSSISWVNCKLVLFKNFLTIPLNSFLQNFFSLSFKAFPEVWFNSINISGFKISNCFWSERKLSPLKNLWKCGLSMNYSILILKSFYIHLCFVWIFHPVYREEISKAWSNWFSIDLIVWGAISSPRTFLRICCWNCINS